MKIIEEQITNKENTELFSKLEDNLKKMGIEFFSEHLLGGSNELRESHYVQKELYHLMPYFLHFEKEGGYTKYRGIPQCQIQRNRIILKSKYVKQLLEEKYGKELIEADLYKELDLVKEEPNFNQLQENFSEFKNLYYISSLFSKTKHNFNNTILALPIKMRPFFIKMAERYKKEIKNNSDDTITFYKPFQKSHFINFGKEENKIDEIRNYFEVYNSL